MNDATDHRPGVPHSVTCRCGRRRGYLPRPGAERDPIGTYGGSASLLMGVLICGHCDYDHAHATVIPREHAIRDVP